MIDFVGPEKIRVELFSYRAIYLNFYYVEDSDGLYI